MPLVLSPMTEEDIPAYSEILWSAFDRGLMPLFYPNGRTPEIDKHTFRHNLKAFRTDPDQRYMKVIDTDLPPGDKDPQQEGRIVSVSLWHVYDHDRTDEEMKKAEEKGKEDGFAPGANVAMMEAFFGALAACKKEILGNRAYIYPHHHRRGAGALHLKWGLGLADELGLPAYLEGSEMGQPLYRRWGFEPLKVLPFDTTKYGGSRRQDHMCMLRPPTKQTANLEQQNSNPDPPKMQLLNLLPILALATGTFASPSAPPLDYGPCHQKMLGGSTHVVQAINDFCSKRDITVPSTYAWTGVKRGTEWAGNLPGKHLGTSRVRIDGFCSNGHSWVPQYWCKKQFLDVCAKGNYNGFGEGFFGKNGCQKFIIEDGYGPIAQ
ncbi:hypothetical protein LTR66_004291 [Elasticomyces elasticus]|nr:hypothetical protein LTR66_004291 [Elasticomyces elasticus]